MTGTDHAAAGNAAVSGTPAMGLKKHSVWLMILLTVVTCGLYYPWWFLRRFAALNQLNTPRRLQLWPFLLFMAFWVFRLAIIVAGRPRPIDQIIGTGPAFVLSMVGFGIATFIIVQCFVIKDMLEDHLAGSEASTSSVLARPTELNGFLTFLFGAYYLQYVINRDVVGAT